MDPLREAARRRPESVALDAPGLTWSYRELDAAASAVTRLVREAGVSPTGRVGLLLPRGPEAVGALHGVPRAGAASAPLHPGWTEKELAAYVGLLEPDLLLASKETRERAEAVAGGVEVRALAAPDLPESGGVDPECARGDPESEKVDSASGGATTGSAGAGPAVVGGDLPAGGASPGGASPRTHTILATSGTTGRPRAVRLTLVNHLACARGAANRMALSPDDRWLATLSLAHVGGVAMVMRVAATGARLVLRGDFEAGRFHDLVDGRQVTHASLVPTMLRRVIAGRKGRAFPSSLRGVLVGGDAAPPDLVREALELDMAVHLTYGLTEASSQVATGTPALARRKPEAVGPPLPGVDVRIGDDGQILVSGPTVTPGLLPQEASGERFEDGWLRTGDVGRLDPEGHLHVIGRRSDRIVTGGVTVDPAAVETVLLRHPAVREVVVVGVPDGEWGERVAALVAARGETPTPEELTDFCRSELSGARLPRRVRFVEALPRNPNGKPDRDAARRLLEEP